MNVLSLFDGISCGQIALNRVGIEYENYYACEIEKTAMAITQKNYPKTIQLGDVTKLDTKTLPKIDLLIGGSPCQGFSFAGKQLNFEDIRSKLFFEYVRIKNELNPKYFLLENVVMKKEYQDVISKYLNCEPIKINSSLVTAAKRNRLYWTNIPNITIPDSKDISFDDINCGDTNWFSQERVNKMKNWNAFQSAFKNKSLLIYTNKKQKLGCICTQNYTTGTTGTNVIFDGQNYRGITHIEAERAMTLPENYTYISGISDNKRCHSIGNGWTVDVIVHIFRNIK